MASLNLFGDDFDSQPPDKATGPNNTVGEEEEELVVLGYACKLFHDDDKAIEVESMLIPWNGDISIQISRYDALAHLLDVNGQSPESSDSEEELTEMLCDDERYLALKTDINNQEQQEEEETKRHCGVYAQVAYDYSDAVKPVEQEEQVEKTAIEQKTEETHVDERQPNESTIDEPFVLPDSLPDPDGLELPATKKLHVIIERTAVFVSKQGTQMEIILKAKQASNQQFDFLTMDHPLNPYYKHLIKCIKSGSYTPQLQVPTKQDNPAHNSNPNTDSDNSDDNDSDEEGYSLHPSLFASKRSVASPIAVSSPGASVPVVSSGDESTEKVLTVRRNPLFSALAPVSLKSTGSSDIETSASTKSHAEAVPLSCYSADCRVSSDPLQHQYNVAYANDPNAPWNSSYYGVPADSMTSQQYWDSVASHVPWDLTVSQPPWIGNNSGPPFVPPPPPPSAYDTPAGILDIPPPPPTEVQAVIDKLAEYVARNGDEFEDMVGKKSDTRFAFLNASHVHYGYYQWKKQQFAAEYSEKIAEQRRKQEAVLHKGRDAWGWRSAKSLFSLLRTSNRVDRSVEQIDQKRSPSSSEIPQLGNQDVAEQEEEEEHVEIVEPIKEITIVKDGGLKPAPVSAEDRLKQERRRKAALLVAKIKQDQSGSSEHNSSHRKRSPDVQSNMSDKPSKRSRPS